MTFLNGIMLAGAAAVAIPIIIHILNRRRAQVVDWGAMQFLEASLAARNRRILIEEYLLMALRCLLLGLLVLALARPRLRTGRLLAAGARDAQDVAIVLDGSLSMSLTAGGKSRFRRAVEEAGKVLDACRRGDAAGVVLAGSVAEPVTPTPRADLAAVRERLEHLAPSGGSMRVLEALHAAGGVLRAGSNPIKKIVLITDGQRVGWDLSADRRWRFLAEAASAAGPEGEPLVIVRTVAGPAQWRNAAAAGLRFSRAVIGTDRDVEIDVTVTNTGTGPVAPEGVELLVDERVVARGDVGRIAGGASASAAFKHRFASAGPHVVAARVLCDDDLPGDNRTVRAVEVLRELPVLIVQGRASARPLAGDGDYLALALAPPAPESADDGELPAGGPARRLVRPTVVAAADVGAVRRFDDYAAVVLVDVPRLPQPAAEALARFVARGGGLLIAPGAKAQPGAYDGWNAPDGKRLTGCRLTEFRRAGPGGEAARVAVNTLDHPALRLLADPAVSDLASARVEAHWALAPDDDPSVSVGAVLDDGDPLLIQRRCGKGFVLTLSVPLARGCSDLPVKKCYVPLVHEAVYYLAAPARRPLNLRPGQQLVWALPGRRRPSSVAVRRPDGRRSEATLRRSGARWQAVFAMTAAPGLYRLVLPGPPGAKAAAPPVATRPAGAAPSEVPFVVLSDARESELELLTEADYRRAGSFIRLVRAETLSELTAAIGGEAPGMEIWPYVAVIVLGLLLAEIAVTRAIAVRRKSHLVRPVSFGAGSLEPGRFARRPSEAEPAEAEEVASA